jgi:CheY-like chemotaxis protein
LNLTAKIPRRGAVILDSVLALLELDGPAPIADQRVQTLNWVSPFDDAPELDEQAVRALFFVDSEPFTDAAGLLGVDVSAILAALEAFRTFDRLKSEHWWNPCVSCHSHQPGGRRERFSFFFCGSLCPLLPLEAPIMTAQTPVDRSPAVPPLPGQTNLATVLVVDDEEYVLQFTSMALQRAGYTVLEAATPAEALHLAVWYQGPIRLLLCDVCLGSISGPTLAKYIQLTRPRMATLFYSGHTRDELIEARDLPSDGAFLLKPFSATELRVRVGEQLAQAVQATAPRYQQLSARDTTEYTPGEVVR